MKLNFIIKSNGSLAENKIKNEIEQLLLKYNHGNKVELHNERINYINFFLNLSQRLDLQSSNKDISLQNLYVYYTWKNLRKQCKNNELKIAPAWDDEFDLPDGSYSISDIQVYIKYIIKKQETLATIPAIHVYINRINNRLVFKIKDVCKVELQTPETKKLFRCTKKLKNKT